MHTAELINGAVILKELAAVLPYQPGIVLRGAVKVMWVRNALPAVLGHPHTPRDVTCGLCTL